MLLSMSVISVLLQGESCTSVSAVWFTGRRLLRAVF